MRAPASPRRAACDGAAQIFGDRGAAGHWCGDADREFSRLRINRGINSVGRRRRSLPCPSLCAASDGAATGVSHHIEYRCAVDGNGRSPSSMPSPLAGDGQAHSAAARSDDGRTVATSQMMSVSLDSVTDRALSRWPSGVADHRSRQRQLVLSAFINDAISVRQASSSPSPRASTAPTVSWAPWLSSVDRDVVTSAKLSCTGDPAILCHLGRQSGVGAREREYHDSIIRRRTAAAVSAENLVQCTPSSSAAADAPSLIPARRVIPSGY